MTPEEIKKRIVVGLFSDDELLDLLVLKGGNALEMVHAIADRASFDLDFSIATRFDDVKEIEQRIRKALEREFARVDLVVFDLSLEERPLKRSARVPDWWGGYQVGFKLADRALFERYGGDIERVRREAVVVGPQEKRIYKIDISAYEFVRTKQRDELDDLTVYVYSLEMIVIEKLRAICQQMERYPYNTTRSPRARDFFDICQIMKVKAIDLTAKENVDLAQDIFQAKQVSMELLNAIADTREFHRSDWDSVRDSVRGETLAFDAYFDSVLKLVAGLKLSWKM